MRHRAPFVLRVASVGVPLALAAVVGAACGSVDPTPIDDDPSADASPAETGARDATSAPDTSTRDAATGPDASLDGSGDATADAADAAPITCPICRYPGGPVSGGNVAAQGLVETSGLAASRVHANVLYAHNDSGDTARIFMIGTNGASRNVVSITGAPAVDWEDVAVGKCPAGSCVFVGDIGDNGKSRTDIALVRFPEPSLSATTVAADVFPLRYPDGPHDAETLLVDDAGAVYVVTKETFGAVSLVAFGVPGTPGVALTGRIVASFTPPTFGVPAVTGGDFFGGPCPRLAIRTYAAVLLFEGTAGEGPADLVKRPFRTLQAPLEQQGEAVAFSADGRSLFTASEGTSVPLNTWSCGP